MNKFKRETIQQNKTEWNRLVEYEVVFHVCNDINQQSRYFNSETDEDALNSFRFCMKNRLSEIEIDEFKKLNRFSNKYEMLDIPQNIL